MSEKSEFLGKDKIFPLLIKLSLPAAVGMIVGSLYNIVDTIFVGQGVGPEAIAALTIAFPLQLLLGAVAQAVGVGAASIISRKLGARDIESAVSTAGTAVSSIVIIAVIMVSALYIFMEPVLIFFGATESILPFTKEYINYIAVGFFFLSFSMATSALIRAEGNTKVAMNGMLIGTILNIALDPLFIFAFKLGIKGAAIATIIAQFVSAFYLLSYYLRKQSVLPLTLRHLKIKWGLLKEAIILGLPNFIQMSGTSIMALIVNNILGTIGGDFAISAYGMIHRLFSLIIMPLLGMVQGFQPAAGYNYGAQKYDRVRETLIKGCILASCLAVAGFALMRLMPRTLMGMFTTDEELIALSSGAIRTFVLGVPVIGVQLIGASYFQAIGKKATSLILNLLRQFIILIPLIFIFSNAFGMRGVWMSFPIADVSSMSITTAFLLFEVRHLSKKHRAVFAEGQEQLPDPSVP